MNRSLRSRLLLGIAATTLVVFAAVAIAMFFVIRTSLLEEFDEMLAAKARALATLVEQQGDELVIKFDDHPMQEFARKLRPEYYQLWDDKRAVVSRSRRLVAGDLEWTEGSLAAPRCRFTPLPDGRPGRLVGVQFLPAVEGESLDLAVEDRTGDFDDMRDRLDFTGRRRVTLVVAKETAEIDRALAHLGWLLLGVSATAIATMLAILSWIVKRSLDPLDDLAAQIAALDEQELATRFQIAQAPQELEPVVARLNDLLARLEEAFQRERVFTADVAHELRTPLAGLRTMLEVALGRARGPAEYRRVLQDCEAVCQDTQRLIETLLSLARIDAGRAVLDRSLVDVAESIGKSWSAFAERADARALSVSFDGPARVLLVTDAKMFRVVLANLCDNAVDYSDRGGTVDIRWQVGPGGLSLVVANTGCNLSEDQGRKVFDRFWRADTARAATGSHAGLGLALCQKVVEVLGGSIDASVRNGCFIVKIDFDAEFVESFAIAERSDEIADDEPIDGLGRGPSPHESAEPLSREERETIISAQDSAAVGVACSEESEKQFARR